MDGQRADQEALAGLGRAENYGRDVTAPPFMRGHAATLGRVGAIPSTAVPEAPSVFQQLDAVRDHLGRLDAYNADTGNGLAKILTELRDRLERVERAVGL